MVDAISGSGLPPSVKAVGRAQSQARDAQGNDTAQNSTPVDKITLSPEAEEAAILQAALDVRAGLETQPDEALSAVSQGIDKLL